MTLNRRQFMRTASGALVYASAASVLRSAGLKGEEPIKVANVLDQTGGLNIYSLKQISGCAMGVEDLNKAGGLLGRPIELLFYDSQSNNQFNSQYATQAFVRGKAHVLQGGITSSSREVMRPIVRKFGGLFFYNSLYEGGVCDRRHVSTGMVPAQQLEALVPYVMGEHGGKRGYILAADYNYGHITAKWMQKIIRENGGEDLAVEFFPLDVTNFAPVISRIQAAKPDVVWSVLVGGAHMAFYRQYEATIGKKNLMLASTTYGVGREQTELSADEAEGILIGTSFVDDLPSPAAKSFVKKFQAWEGNSDYVGEYGEYGYRGIMLWAEAVRKAGSPEPDAVIAALDGVQYDGAGGLYTIDGKTNHTTMDIHVVRGNRTGSFDLIKSFGQRPPKDTQLVCDLDKNPDDTTQYEPEV
ncbi:MAG: transporter substrate-binding protein [Alphaproteobacteria bacterium]|jgi:branched-chain amino acid transport system substrate-binding protein|nr:transporter substrate-binding protein [Alphaproteobacteria bacterium]